MFTLVLGTAKEGFGLAGPMGAGAQGGGAGSYKPPFKNVDIVYINIKASLFEVKKRWHYTALALSA